MSHTYIHVHTYSTHTHIYRHIHTYTNTLTICKIDETVKRIYNTIPQHHLGVIHKRCLQGGGSGVKGKRTCVDIGGGGSSKGGCPHSVENRVWNCIE